MVKKEQKTRVLNPWEFKYFEILGCVVNIKFSVGELKEALVVDRDISKGVLFCRKERGKGKIVEVGVDGAHLIEVVEEPEDPISPESLPGRKTYPSTV